MLSHIPARELDEPVTKEFLRAELAELRTDFGRLEARVNERLRQQTIWMSGLMTTLVGVVALLS